MSWLQVMCCEFSEMFICEISIYMVRKVEALGGRKEGKRGRLLKVPQ